MTTVTHHTTTDSDVDRARRAVWPVAGGVAVVAASLSAAFAHSMPEALVEVPFIAVATLLVFGVVVRRGLRGTAAGGRGIAMGAIGLLVLLPAFWSGLPLLLGSAGALLGYAGKRAESGAGKAMIAFVLGLLVCAGYLAIYAGDYMSTHGIG